MEIMFVALKKRMQVVLIISGAAAMLTWAFANYCRFQSVWSAVPLSRKVPYFLFLGAMVLFIIKWLQMNREERRIKTALKNKH